MAVADARSAPGQIRCPRLSPPGESRLAACPYFVTDLLGVLRARVHYAPARRGCTFLIFIEGRGTIARRTLPRGRSLAASRRRGALRHRPAAPTRILRTWVPA